MDRTYHQALLLGQEVGSGYALTSPRRLPRGQSGDKLGARAGASVEYMDHRDYQPGDDLRSIDWFAFGRSDRLTVKLFREEVSPHLDLVIDTSRSMAVDREDSPKARATVTLASALATAAMSAGFTHTAWLAGQMISPVVSGSQPPAQWSGIAFDYAPPADRPPLPSPPRWRRQGVRVLLSDLFLPGDPATLLAPLAEHAAALTVVQILDQVDAHPPSRGSVRLVDSETGTERDLFIDGPAETRYYASLARHQDLWNRACQQHGAIMVTLIAQRLLADWDLRDLLAAQLLKVAWSQTMLLTLPWALLSLIALPLLTVIYLLRNRFRRQTISSLMLWADQASAREGGLRRSWPHFPLLFYLEILTLLLLAAAAAGPLVNLGWKRTPLVVVLDDSYAMSAKAGESAQQRALVALREEIERDRHLHTRLIVAGRQPRLLGDPVRNWHQAELQLANWQCQSPQADIGRAVAFAADVAGPDAHILVISDVKPQEEPQAGRIAWWAVGQKADNVAFVNAARTVTDQEQRCLVEIANLSDQPTHATLIVQAIDAGDQAKPQAPELSSPQRMELDLSANETRRLTFKPPVATAAVRLSLPNDSLAIDNQMILLPPPVDSVRVNLAITDEPLRLIVAKALDSTGRVVRTAVDPQLVIVDQKEIAATQPGATQPATTTQPSAAAPTTLPAVTADGWRLIMVHQSPTQAFVGPFVIDYAHPLVEGLMLEGIVWSAAGATATSGADSVIAAGNVNLLSDSALPSGAHDLRLYLRTDLSNLPRSPNWPILFWNLLRWRASEFDGPAQVNVRLGTDAQITLDRKAHGAQVTNPDGSKHDLPFAGRKVVIPTPLPGLYHVRAGEKNYSLSVAALDRNGSELRNKISDRWGQWVDPVVSGHDWRDMTWILVLLAVLVLGLHLLLMARAAGAAGISGGGGAP